MSHTSSALELPAADTTIAVVLGASEYPQKPAWSNPVLGASARAVRDYLRSPTGLAMRTAQLLDLFDAAGGPADQLFQVEAFLKTAGAGARDLIVYYVGHGCFDHDDYCLGIRATQRDREFISTIESRKLARIIREGFARKRVYVILDSCFAASAAHDWMGDEIEVAVRKMSQPLPRQGTAFLAAASKFDVTRAPRSERYTVFTGAVLDTLTGGVDRVQSRLSLYELYVEVRDHLQRRVSDEEARPELHVPSQREGDVSRLELFPNAYLQRAPWAVESGRDAYGPWTAFEVAGVRQRLRWIPPGRFVMGSPETELGRWDDEGPQREVTLTRGYWLGETPVTQALWLAVMGENPSYFEGELARPVESVSWDDCQAFLGRLNAQVAGLGARLPTEAEWERACRGGTGGATWVGDLSGTYVAPELNAIAWYHGNSGGETHPVGRKAANPYGLYDMIGNVYEWCADAGELRPYPAEAVTDPLAAGQDSFRVHRGGSWFSDAGRLRAAFRDAFGRPYRYGFLGFRLAGGPVSAPSLPGEEPRSGDGGRGAGCATAPVSARDATTLQVARSSSD